MFYGLVTFFIIHSLSKRYSSLQARGLGFIHDAHIYRYLSRLYWKKMKKSLKVKRKVKKKTKSSLFCARREDQFISECIQSMIYIKKSEKHFMSRETEEESN